MHRNQRSQALTGIVLIVVGLILLAQRLQVWPDLDLSRLWPLLIVAFGVGRLATPDEEDRRGHGRYGGLWFVFTGALFLMHNYGVMTIAQSWPLFIVGGGVSILLGRRGTDGPAAPVGKV
jgi:hypothetical protein